MTTFAVAVTVLVLAIVGPQQVDGAFAKASDAYKELAEAFINKVKDVFFHNGRATAPHVKVLYNIPLSMSQARQCDSSGASSRLHQVSDQANCQAFEICGQQGEECTTTAKQMFGDVATWKPSSSSLPAGVYAKCADLKASLGVTKAIADCN